MSPGPVWFRVSGFGFRVSGHRFPVRGSGFGVRGSGFGDRDEEPYLGLGAPREHDAGVAGVEHLYSAGLLYR